MNSFSLLLRHGAAILDIEVWAVEFLQTFWVVPVEISNWDAGISELKLNTPLAPSLAYFNL